MKNFKPLFILLILCETFAQSGCKKYEEGPSLSLRTKKSRLANNWKVEKAEVNGIDSTEAYRNYFVTIDKSGTFAIKSEYGNTTGHWQFSTNKDQIVVTWVSGSVMIWHIRRLKEKELWIVEEIKNERTEIHFKELL